MHQNTLPMPMFIYFDRHTANICYIQTTPHEFYRRRMRTIQADILAILAL